MEGGGGGGGDEVSWGQVRCCGCQAPAVILCKFCCKVGREEAICERWVGVGDEMQLSQLGGSHCSLSGQLAEHVSRKPLRWLTDHLFSLSLGEMIGVKFHFQFLMLL